MQLEKLEAFLALAFRKARALQVLSPFMVTPLHISQKDLDVYFFNL